MDDASVGSSSVVAITGAEPDDFDGLDRVTAAHGIELVSGTDVRGSAGESVDRPGAGVDDDGPHPGSREGPAPSPELVVAVGTEAVAGAAGLAPVLPVDCDRSTDSVGRDQVAAALDAAFRGETVERTWPLLDVTIQESKVPADDDRAGTDGRSTTRALFDVAVVTDEPATISEFTVRDRGERAGRFRADGVVVATPAGSGDYATAAGGSTLTPGTDVVNVVPIAPFDTARPRWVLPPTEVTIAVERGVDPVALQVDGRVEASLDVEDVVVTERAGTARTVSVAGATVADH